MQVSHMLTCCAWIPLFVDLSIQVLVMACSLIFLAMGIFGVSMLEYEFDYNIFLPEDSPSTPFIAAVDEYFPGFQWNGMDQYR